LEFAQGVLGLWSKNPVDAHRIKAQLGECLLQRRHVVTAQVGTTHVEQARSELPTGFEQCRPGEIVNVAVGGEAPHSLKGLDGNASSFAKYPRVVGEREMSKRR
jgi:hypothetical protein